MNEIPCKDCLVLAACKSKSVIICDLIYDYMEINVHYTDGKMNRTNSAIIAWMWLEELFQRKDQGIRFIGRTSERR